MANKITTILDLDNRGFTKSIKAVRRSVAETDGAFNKMKVGAKGLGVAMQANVAATAIAAGAAMVAFGAKSVQAASRLAESANAVSKSFGAAAEDVLEVGENAAESFGLSKSAFNEAAVAFASFAETISGGRNTSKVIEDLTGRAADFASVMNIDVAEAATVFRSGLSGETEPLKRFGIDLSAAAVEAHALATGLVESKSEMTEAIKVQARYGLLMESTGQFAGDFADTADGLANSSRTLSAKIEDLAADFGEELTPQIEGAVGVAVALVDALAAIKSFTGPGFGQFWGDDIEEVRAEQEAMFAERAMSSDEIARREEANQKRIAAAYIQNQMGLKRYQEQIAADEHVNAYLEHQRGMQRETEKTAEEAEEAAQRAIDAYDRLNRKLDDRSAYLDIEDAFSDVGKAAERAADTSDKSFAEQRQDARDHERAVINLKNQVLEYGEEVGDLPPEATTEILALIDEGKLMEAAIRLEELERTRTVRINPVIGPVVGGTGRIAGARAAGGPVSPGSTYLVGEDGPELVTPSRAGFVHDAAKTSSMGAAAAGGGSPMNITINTGADPKAVVDAIRTFERHHGKGWRG